MLTLKSIARIIIPKRFRRPLADLYGAVRYRGDRVECPCCCGRFSRFVPSPNDGRPGAMCPRCRSLERQRLLWMYLEEKTNLFSEKLHVLQFAPARVFRENLSGRSNIEYICGDLDPAMAAATMDITDIPREGASFDAVLCSHVLEHVRDDRRAIAEIFRVLKPGGWAAVMVPVNRGLDATLEDPAVTSPAERRRLYGHPGHVRWYGLDFRERLEEAGFAVTVEDYAGELAPEVVRRCGLAGEGPIYVCRRPPATRGEASH